MTTEEEADDTNDYSQAKIYKIVSPSTDLVYYGSTCNPLEIRFQQHIRQFNKGKKYYSSQEVIAFGDAFIELVENFPCHSKTELRQREGYYIRNNDCVVNKKLEGRTRAEYYQDNKAEIDEKHRIYYQDNKAEIYEKHRIYKENHKQEIREQKKIYYQDNQQEINEKDKARYDKIKNNPEWKFNRQRNDVIRRIRKGKKVLPSTLLKYQINPADFL